MARILGYVYDNTKSADFYNRGFYSQGDNGSETFIPYYPSKTVQQILPDAAKIPVYAPPIPITYNGAPLSDQQLFQVGASIMDAADAKPPKNIREAGTLDSNYVSAADRQKYGLPSSFDMLRNIDPSQANWGMQNAQIYNPQAGGSGLREVISDLAPVAALVAGAFSLGSALSGFASAASVGATATEAAIDTAGLAGGLSASGISIPMALPSLSQVANFAVQAAVNPVNAIESTALTAAGVPSQIASATVALANGASLEKVIQGAGLSQIGNATGSSVQQSVTANYGDAIGRVAGSAAQSAIQTAMITGGDPEKTLKAALTGGASAVRGDVLNAILPTLTSAVNGALSSISDAFKTGADLVSAATQGAQQGAASAQFETPGAAQEAQFQAPTTTPETGKVGDLLKQPTEAAPGIPAETLGAAPTPTFQEPTAPTTAPTTPPTAPGQLPEPTAPAPTPTFQAPTPGAAPAPSSIVDFLQKTDSTFPTFEPAPAPAPDIGGAPAPAPSVTPTPELGAETPTPAATDTGITTTPVPPPAPAEGRSVVTIGGAPTPKPAEITPFPIYAGYSPGSSALAQALRVGDVGAPIFGGEKEGRRRNVWNIKSLRVKDETGS